MQQKKKKSRKVISYVLALAMVLSTMTGIVPGMSITAYAAAVNDITINSAEHGSVTASPTTAESGTTVTLTAQPEASYKLKSISARPIISEIFTYTYSSSGNYGYNGTYFNLKATDFEPSGWDAQKKWNQYLTISSKSESTNIDSIVLTFEFNLTGTVEVDHGTATVNSSKTITINNINATSVKIQTTSNDYISSATVYGTGEKLALTGTSDPNVYQFVMPDNKVSVSAEFEESPLVAQTVTAPTAATGLTYTGQELALLTGGASVSEGNGNTEATIQYSLTPTDNNSWVDSYTAVKATNAGEYKVYYRVAGNDTYAVFVSSNEQAVPVTIAKADSVTLEDAQKPVAKTGDDVVYTGEPIELVTAPTADLPLDYEAYYSTDDGVTWSKDIPEKEDPGKYTIKVKYVSAGKNCEDIILEDITVTITPADKTALTDAIAAAKEYYDTIKDDYKEVAEKLNKAIKAAEEVAAKNKLTKSEVSTAAEALNTAKATAEAEVKDIDDTKAAQAVIDKINELKPVENIKPEDRTKIEAAREAYKKLSDDQKTKLTGLDSTAVSTLEAAEKALIEAEKAAFDDEKEVQKKAADALTADGDSDASKKLIEDAKKAIDALAYDESKTVDENKAALAAIVSKLKSDLADNRAADKVIEAINKLPSSDKVTTTDKAAIEAARKAYDALTADQKKKVPADVLKKLTDAEKALKAAKELEAAKKEAQAAMNEQVTVTQKGNKFTVKWKKAKSADGYYVYAQYCGKKFKKPVKTIKKNTTTKVTIKKINGKKLNLKKQFRVYVVPYKNIDGKKVKLGKSMVGHVVGSKNTKYSNVKKLTLKKKKYTVKVGKTAKIKAKVTLVNKNKKHIPKGHGAKFRYKSSDTSIATVSKNGKIKGIKKGKCTIYVYSINGLTKKAKITVK